MKTITYDETKWKLVSIDQAQPEGSMATGDWLEAFNTLALNLYHVSDEDIDTQVAALKALTAHGNKRVQSTP